MTSEQVDDPPLELESTNKADEDETKESKIDNEIEVETLAENNKIINQNENIVIEDVTQEETKVSQESSHTVDETLVIADEKKCSTTDAVAETSVDFKTNELEATHNPLNKNSATNSHEQDLEKKGSNSITEKERMSKECVDSLTVNIGNETEKCYQKCYQKPLILMNVVKAMSSQNDGDSEALDLFLGGNKVISECAEDENLEKAKVLKDPILKKITTRFVQYLGPLPNAQSHALRLRNSPTFIGVILVQPRSLAEISRVIRSARAMHLFVRCCGNHSSFESAVLVDQYSVLIQLTFLSDSKKIEMVRHINADQSHIWAVQVLAGVTIKQLYAYQYQNQINLPTDIEETKHTVVGSVVAMRHTLVSSRAGKFQSTLADMVLKIRIVNKHGNLITYSNDGTAEMKRRLKTVVGNIGSMGVVYDVVLGIAAEACAEIRSEYASLYGILQCSDRLMNKVRNSYGLQLIYLPFNSVEYNVDTGEPRMFRWVPEEDKVILRTIDVTHDSNLHQRHTFRLIDELGPDFTFLTEPKLTPLAIQSAQEFEKIMFSNGTTKKQLLTWSIQCFDELPYPCNDLTITMPVGKNGEDFSKAMTIIADVLRTVSVEHQNFSLNVCIRVSFTGPSEVSLCPIIIGTDDTNTDIAHIRLIGIREQEAFNNDWLHFAKETAKQIFNTFPHALPQWDTHWSCIDGIDERLRNAYKTKFPEFKDFLDDQDRDGMFLTTRMRQIFYPQLTGYRQAYLQTHNELLTQLASEIFPSSFVPTKNYIE